MNKTTPILLVLMLLGGSLFAEDLSKVVPLDKGDVDLLTATKLADYSYKITDKNGSTLLTDTVANDIDKAKNQMLDCGVYTCDYKVVVTAKQDLKFDATTLKGAYTGIGVSVQKIFFIDTDLTENTDLTVPLKINASRTYVIRFEKDIWERNVDIYHTIYGQERKDAANWNASGGTKTTIIDPVDGQNYTVHTFTTSGVFATNGSRTVQVLVVAGGAGGGGIRGGGGGSGGVNYSAAYTATGNITVTIGAKGLGGTGVPAALGTNGGNSVFGTMTTIGGGAGASGNTSGLTAPNGGGSGGGAYAKGYGANGTAGQGYSGGNATFEGGYPSGGGGGSGGHGWSAPNDATSGDGGMGSNWTINGTSFCIAGGGGGGYATPGNGKCGGGIGGYNPAWTGGNAVANTGSGGGGGAYDGVNGRNGGNGSTGLVIVRYLTNDTIWTLTFTPPTQPNGTSIPGSLMINVSRSDANLTNCTAYINGTPYAMTNTSDANLSCSLTQYLVNGTYNYYVYAFNSTNASRNATSETRIIYIDSSVPSGISITSMSQNGYYYLNRSVNVSFTSNNPKNCTLELNGTNYTMMLVSNSLCQYNMTNVLGNITAKAFVSSNASLTGNSTPITVYFFNQSGAASVFTNPHYALYTTTLNLSVTNDNNYRGNFSANVTYNGTTYVAVCTQASPYNCTATVQPPVVSAVVNLSINWTYMFLNASLTQYNNSLTNVTPSGMMVCGPYSNVSSLNLTLIDEYTGALVNGSFNFIATYALNPAISTTLTKAGNTTFTICVVPNQSMNISTTITATATGYYGKTLTLDYTVSNVMISQTILMSNASLMYPTILKIVRSPNLPVESVVISVYKFTLPSTASLTTMGTTDAGGSVLAYLIPNTQLYLYNFTSGGVNYTFGPEVVTCSASTCYRTFTIGEAGSIPIALTGEITGVCNYFNTTRILNCVGSDTSSTLTSLTLQANRLGNETPVCDTTVAGSSANITCTLPATCGLYAATFSGKDADGNIYALSGATVTTTVCGGATSYGRDGWIAMLLLFGTIAMVGFFNIAVAMMVGAAALFVGLLLGLIPFDANFVVIISMAIFGAIIAYRTKV